MQESACYTSAHRGVLVAVLRRARGLLLRTARVPQLENPQVPSSNLSTVSAKTSGTEFELRPTRTQSQPHEEGVIFRTCLQWELETRETKEKTQAGVCASPASGYERASI
jgi:hypothetical protein